MTSPVDALPVAVPASLETLAMPGRAADVRVALRIAVSCWLVYLLFLDPYPASMATDLIGLGVSIGQGAGITLPEGMRAEFAYRDGRYYSGLPPGASIPIAALYAVLRPLLPADPEALLLALSVLGTVLVAAPFAALGPAALYLVLRRLGVSTPVAIESCLVLAFATTNFGYATGYFKENAATTLLIAAFALLVRGRLSAARRPAPWLLAGLLIGVAMSMVYASVLPGVVLGLYALAVAGIRPAALLAAGAVPPTVLVLWYHAVAFGSPLATGYTYKAWITPHASWFGPLDVERLAGMLVSPGYGLLVFAPVVALGLAGLGRLVRARGPWRAEAACCLAIFVVTWVVYGHYRVPVDFWIPLPHDMGLTVRYVGVTVPFVMVGYALTRDAWPPRPRRIVTVLTVVFGYLSAVPGLNPSFVAPLVYALKVTVSTLGVGMLFGQFLPNALGIETLHTTLRRPDIGAADLLAAPLGTLVPLALAQFAFVGLFLAAAGLVGVVLARMWRPDPRNAGA